MHELPTQQHASCIISRTSIRQSHSTVRLLMHEKSSWKSTLCSINTNSHITALSLRQQKIDQMENNSTFPQWTLKMWSHTILQRSLHCWQSIHNEISNCILEQLLFAMLVFQAKHLQCGCYAEQMTPQCHSPPQWNSSSHFFFLCTKRSQITLLDEQIKQHAIRNEDSALICMLKSCV